MNYFSQIPKKSVLWIAILTVSLLVNLFLLSLEALQTRPNAPNRCVQDEKPFAKGTEPQPDLSFASTAEILPHPPAFLEGRKIRFVAYSVQTIQGKKWILFKEIKGKSISDLKVDAEAVRWF